MVFMPNFGSYAVSFVVVLSIKTIWLRWGMRTLRATPKAIFWAETQSRWFESRPETIAIWTDIAVRMGLMVFSLSLSLFHCRSIYWIVSRPQRYVNRRWRQSRFVWPRRGGWVHFTVNSKIFFFFVSYFHYLKLSISIINDHVCSILFAYLSMYDDAVGVVVEDNRKEFMLWQ